MGINFDNGSLLSACPGRNCNIDTFNELTINQHDCGLCNMQCIHCGACYWTKEQNTKKKYLKCCSDGTIKLDPIHVPTPLLRSYMERTIRPVALHKNFFSKIRWLNTSVSFASCKFFILYVFKYNILRSYLRLLLHLFIVILLLNFFNFSYTFFIAKFTDFTQSFLVQIITVYKLFYIKKKYMTSLDFKKEKKIKMFPYLTFF